MRRPIVGILSLLAIAAAIALAPRWGRAESPDDILVIANKGVAADALSVDEIKSLFTRSRGTWKNGGKVIPVHAKEGSDLRKAFRSRVLRMSLEEEQSFWQDQKIRKGLTPPAEFGNPLKAVFSLSGSVSYVFRRDYRDGVAKILLVLPK